ncbi:hypothetical protein KPL78_13895 [Roseomonas sp. HJA6]|uniref:Uncharacterized protein n=1 Tax=Roseomonas alba TaxID=2846776 RepID=A0ABS7A9H6_9PROT|nr:hypothetical protein [Neoroseomonas alba]MBW6398952.1 hypothetical protein [Neoroseomonas alba]
MLSLLREGAAIDQIELSEQTRVAEAMDRGWILRDHVRRDPARRAGEPRSHVGKRWCRKGNR